MERKAVENILVMAVLGALLAAGANGQSTCTNALISLSPCLNYISGNASTPSSSCCTQLENVVGSQPQCLCQVLNGGASSLGITVNQTQALALPAACNVQTQPISRCNGGSPASSPAGTPESPSTPAGTEESPSTTVPSSPSSKNTPPTDSSTGSSIRSSFPLFTALVLFASYASAS